MSYEKKTFERIWKIENNHRDISHSIKRIIIEKGIRDLEESTGAK